MWANGYSSSRAMQNRSPTPPTLGGGYPKQGVEMEGNADLTALWLPIVDDAAGPAIKINW